MKETDIFLLLPPPLEGLGEGKWTHFGPPFSQRLLFLTP